MHKKAFLVLILSVSALLLAAFSEAAQPQSGENTEINKRDASPKELTAEQQKETKQDRELTQKIRRAVVEDKSLSRDAHNVKIITMDGMVTLKGPVKSEEEKRAIEEKASRIAGQGNIKNELNIAPEKKRK